MSKTVELQIEKSRNLVEGLRKHLCGIGGGVTNDEIGQMEQSLKELETANAEVDRLREELTPKVKQMNEVLARVKDAYADKKGGAAMLITSWRAPDLERLLSARALGRLWHPRQAIIRPHNLNGAVPDWRMLLLLAYAVHHLSNADYSISSFKL